LNNSKWMVSSFSSLIVLIVFASGASANVDVTVTVPGDGYALYTCNEGYDSLDYGDAPDPSYPTLLISDGARHVIVSGIMLGSKIDDEPDGQPNDGATGDDVAGVDDEDGVTFTTVLVPGGMANVEVEATAPGKLDAWIDFDNNGNWAASDQIFASEPISSGINYLQFQVPETATPNVATFARFRFSTSGGLLPTGLADDGEVEDYAVEVLKDSDGDGAPDSFEGGDDRDGDGIPNYLDYDPSGYFYNESDGQIISGGKIGVTGPGNANIVEDGSGGYYEFWTDGTPGLYEMTLTVPSGYTLSPTCQPQPGPYDPTGKPNPVYLGSGEYGSSDYLASNLCGDNPYYLSFNLEPGDPFVMTNNIPLARLNSIGDRVWNDLDGDGCQDDDEPGVPGISVTLQYENGTKYAETSTDPDGLYLFSDIPPGRYRVRFETLSGYSFCPIHQCDRSMDSDAYPTTGLTDLIALETNENEMTIDAGLHASSSLNVSKTVDKKSAKRGEVLTYTITICNLGGLTAKNVVVEDFFDRSVEFVYAEPAPYADGLWRFAEIPAGECVTITLAVRVPKQDFEFEMAQGVSGRGYVNVANDYSTTPQPYTINNRVKVSSGAVVATDSESVSISADPGTELETREHGSGIYESDELVEVRTENKSIEMEMDISAVYAPTTLGLYNNRSVSYSSKWTEIANAKNRVTGASLSEQYRHSTSIDRDSRMFLDENESVMEVNSDFEGMGHIGFLKMPPNSLSPHNTSPTFQSREDYLGSFKVMGKTDEYGSAVTSTKSAEGQGLVVVDKRVGTSQRSYETGTGNYVSDEHIETNTNYIAKEIGIEYEPMTSLELTDDRYIDSAIKWKEGMESKTAGISYIGEEYTNVETMAKTTVARGLNEMETDANFSGNARYRTVLVADEGNETEIDLDEQYEGDYSIMRRILFTGVPKYDRPHLNVTKALDGIVEETKFGAKTSVRAGESRDETIEVATYTISIENDGNKALGPIYVRDVFPPNTNYINASMRPSELTSSHANWTLTHLAIGDTATVVLNLDVTEHVSSEMVNRVEVCGGYSGDEWVCAYNYSALDKGWLSCDIDDNPIAVIKTGEIDSTNSSVVGYRIAIENRDDTTRVAIVRDSLPYGMVLIDSTVPFASYENGLVVWNMVQIEPYKTAMIEYDVEALWSGRFENAVEVEARSVNDGSVAQTVYAKSIVEVGEVEEKSTPTGWQPPDWEFVSTCEGDLVYGIPDEIGFVSAGLPRTV